eukprot:4623714-Pleurochrysis_carterae.AAC.3
MKIVAYPYGMHPLNIRTAQGELPLRENLRTYCWEITWLSRARAKRALLCTSHDGRTNEKFSGEAAQAAEELGRRARAAKRTWIAVKDRQMSARPAAIDWAGMDLRGWNECGAMSCFRMKSAAAVLFTEARNSARAGTDEDEGQVIVRLLDGGGAAPRQMSAERLIAESDGALAGILRYDGRRGAAVPLLRVHGEETEVLPVEKRGLRKRVWLAVGRDEPQVVLLQTAMKALGLQWEPLEQAPTQDEAAGATEGRPKRALSSGSMAGESRTPWAARALAAQLRMLAGAGGE